MKITILNGTTGNPLQTIGERAGICWGGDVSNKEKNIRRAIDCIRSGHGRVLEYVAIEFVVEDISARAAREIYTHIAGGPARLQESTRYVDCENFRAYLPSSIAKDAEGSQVYLDCMQNIRETYKNLISLGFPKEDIANILPLGMNTKVVMKANLRMIENLMNQRLCKRAYKEMRSFASLLADRLAEIDDEWSQIAKNLFVPKCKKIGYCTEIKCCGLSKKKEVIWNV